MRKLDSWEVRCLYSQIRGYSFVAPDRDRWTATQSHHVVLGPVLPVFHFQLGESDPNRGRIRCFAQNKFTKPEQGLLEKVKENLIQKEVCPNDEYGCKCLCHHNQVEREERVCTMWFPWEIYHREQQWWSGQRHIRTSGIWKLDILANARIYRCGSGQFDRANRQPNQPSSENYHRDHSISKLL